MLCSLLGVHLQFQDCSHMSTVPVFEDLQLWADLGQAQPGSWTHHTVVRKGVNVGCAGLPPHLWLCCLCFG